MYTRFLYPSPVANGDSWFHEGLPNELGVDGVNAFVEESVNKEPDTVFNNKLVPDIGVSGAVLGVKLLV